MGVIKENVYQSLAQRTLVSKEKKRSSRSDLEIVKTQEKFGTKHQRPCGLCEQSFSEVNLILAVPFKVCFYRRVTVDVYHNEYLMSGTSSRCFPRKLVLGKSRDFAGR